MVVTDQHPASSAELDMEQRRWEPRVLVVDDDDLSRIAATELLRGLGLTVDSAHGGKEALTKSVRWPYVAVFMDCEMPDVDGYRATRQLRARDGRHQHTPVIAMTSKPRSVSLASGMDHHLTKPLEAGILRADCQRLGLLVRNGVPASTIVAPVDFDGPLLGVDRMASDPNGHRNGALRAAGRFIREAMLSMPLLWRSINCEDAAALRRVAEHLRDRARAVGTPRVADIYERLAQVSADGGYASWAVSFEHLTGALLDTTTAIRARIDAAPELDSTDTSSLPSPPLAPVPPAVEPVRVALCDDDPLAQIAVSAMLRSADWVHLVGIASGTQEIVDLAEREQPDVVVLDWMMPDGGGREAARRILDRRRETVIVALTASDSLDALAEMTSAGATCLVAKGGSAAQLTGTIARALKKTAAARDARPERRPGRLGRLGRRRIGVGVTPRTGASGDDLLDPAGALRLQSEFGLELLDELVSLFAAQTPGRLRDLRQATAIGDATAVGAGAHQLRGGCLTLAAAHMAERCYELELAAGEGALGGADELIDEIESDFGLTRVALEALAHSAPHD
jgi:CheY-like chemotaxis protein/HPt (histidine-containing phosphotransfer) domain-containing protein